MTMQQNPAGNPFSLEITGGSIRDGMVGSAFVNDGGILRITGTDALDVMGMALVSTANDGATFLTDLEVSSSDIDVS